MRRQTLDSLLRDIGEEIAHQEGADLAEYSQYADDPIGFMREVLDDDPWSMQRHIARTVEAAPLVTVRSCHAAGKDWLSARLALWFAYARQGLVILTGPTSTQVSEILMRGEIRAAFQGSGLPGHLGVQALRPEGKGEGRAGILARTSNSVSALTGFHDTDVLYAITEAQSPDTAPAWTAAFGVATGARDRILTVGNPVHQSGRFYRAHRPDSDWYSFRISAAMIPNVAQGEEVIPGLMSPQGVERLKKEFGPKSAEVATRVRAEFPDAPEGSLFRRSQLEAAARRHEDDALEQGDVVCALDVARSGPNDSVLAIRSGPVIREIVTLRSESTADLISEVRAALSQRSLGRVPIIVDSVGIGGYVADRLRELRYPAVDFRGGAKASDPNSFRNARAESYWKLRLLLEENRVALPRDETLFEELLATRRTTTSDGAIQLEAKHLITSRLGRSPDRADATSMALYPKLGSDAPDTEPHEQPSYEGDVSGNFLDDRHPREVVDEDRAAGWSAL